MAAGYGASGKWQIRRTQLDAMLLRSLMQTLAERIGQHPHYRHVAAHSGDPYNDFVDTLAYDAYHQDIRGPPLDFDVRKLLDREHPLCAHWPLVVRLLAQKKTVPTVQNGTLHWQYPNAIPDSDVVWKDLEEAEEPMSAVHMLQLRCVTYNVQTLKDSGDPVGIGASSFLRAQLIDRHYDIVFLQETRARQSCVQETVDYRRYISEANAQGGGGTEIWLSKKSRWAPNNILTWELPNNVVVLEATAEYLILRVDIHGQPLFLISAHGPHAGHEKEEVQEWWHRLDQHFGRLVGQSATIIGIDANAHFQESIQGAIGEAGLENKGNEPARMMGEFLTRWGLWSPSTFTTIHHGPHGTWRNPHRGTWHRCDYLVLSGNFYDEEILTWVDGNIDAASGALDHMPVAIQMIVAWRDSRSKRNRRQPHIDLLALKEATPQQVEDALQRCTNIPWGLNVHEHGAEFVRLVREGLATAFPTQKKGPHRDYITKETWELRNRRRDIRRRLYKRQREVRSSDVCAAFQAWRHNKSISAYLAQGQKWYLRTLLQNLHDRNQLRTLGPAIKRRLRADRDRFCQQVAEEAASLPPSIVMQKMRCIGVMGKRRRREARPLHQITDKEGNLLQDADAINARWQQHFEELEDGHACTKEDLLNSCVRVQQQRTKIVPSWSELPTILDIEESFRLNKTGRASFFDGIPTDLCHLFPQILAKVFYELALKQTLHIAEPITFKGGVLIHAYKGKGSATACGSYRSLMVSSVLAKSLHRVLRNKCMATFRDTAMPLQLGGLPGKAVSQGAQCLVAFAASCRRRKTSLGILFIDIRQAFYRLVRQHVIQDQDIDRSTQRLFQTLDLPPSAFQEFAHELAQPSAVETAGVDPFVQQHVAECLQATWFRLKDSNQISATRKGSRPGDNMADLLFTFAFRRIMARILEVIEADNIDMSFSGCGDPHPFPQYMEVQYCTNFKTLGPVWADDLAVLVESTDAQVLLPKLRVIARTIIDMLAIYGMQVNSDRGKSELVLDLRGSGAHQARQEIYRHRQPCLDVETRHGGVVHLNIVAKYKHLGTLFAAKGSMMPEIRQRIGQARSEFQRYRKQIYANKALPTRTRVELFKSLVLSGLSFNVAIWPVLTKQEHGAFTGGLHGLYNSLAYAIWGDTVYEWREEQVISKLQVVDAPTLTILARLRHLHHLVCQGDEYVWAFVHRDEGWLGLIAHDLLWLQRQCSRATPQQDPRDDWSAWEALVRQRGVWKSLLKRATRHWILQRVKHSEWYGWHRQLLEILKAQQMWLDNKTVRNDTIHGCLKCGIRFASKAAWSVHCFKLHGRVTQARAVAQGETCVICHKIYATHDRLINHLRYSQKCFKEMRRRNLYTLPQPARNSVEELRARHVAMRPVMQVQGPVQESGAQEIGRHFNNNEEELIEQLAELFHNYEEDFRNHNQLCDVQTLVQRTWDVFQQSTVYPAEIKLLLGHAISHYQRSLDTNDPNDQQVFEGLEMLYQEVHRLWNRDWIMGHLPTERQTQKTGCGELDPSQEFRELRQKRFASVVPKPLQSRQGTRILTFVFWPPEGKRFAGVCGGLQ